AGGVAGGALEHGGDRVLARAERRDVARHVTAAAGLPEAQDADAVLDEQDRRRAERQAVGGQLGGHGERELAADRLVRRRGGERQLGRHDGVREELTALQGLHHRGTFCGGVLL